MFITKVSGNYMVWHNKESEDWLAALPKFYACDKSAIDLWYIAPAHRANLSNEMRNPMLMAVTANVLTGSRRPGDELPYEEVLSCPVVPISAWPYDESGKFTGFSELA